MATLGRPMPAISRRGIDTALHLVDRFEQGYQTFEGEMLRLHRNQHPVSRNKRCYGDDAQRGHTVDQAVVIFILIAIFNNTAESTLTFEKK